MLAFTIHSTNPRSLFQFVALLVQNLERLDEKVKEDADGVHNTLAIIENTCELKNTEICKAAGEQGLLQWLLKRIRVRQYDANKLYASEILAILLQNNESNQHALGEIDGIDVLLQSLAYYKRRDPSGVDEIEMMENLFDCLCSCLMFAPNRERFLKGEGLQLMILMLREKKMSRRSALKVLNHAMCGHEGVDNCSKFIEVYGLRSLFPAFMKPPKKSKKADTSEFEHEEHVCSIIGSLFANAQNPALRERLVGKFVENDCEKVDRLMELHFKYLRRVRNVEEQLRREKRMAVSVETEDTDEDLFLRRLDAGLFTLQQVDYIIAELCTSEVGVVNGRIDTLLNQHGDSLQTVQETLYEFAAGLGEGADPSSSDAIAKQKERLTTLASKL